MPFTLSGTRILYGNLQVKTHMDMSQEAFCVEIYRKNAAHYFPGPHFVRKFTGKNAHGHCRRAILRGNLQEKCRTPGCPPRSNTGPFTLTVRTPSVWPHCLGKNVPKFNFAKISQMSCLLCKSRRRCGRITNTRMCCYRRPLLSITDSVSPSKHAVWKTI